MLTGVHNKNPEEYKSSGVTSESSTEVGGGEVDKLCSGQLYIKYIDVKLGSL